MGIELVMPDAAGLEPALGALREWQRDDAPFQLHPGDVGWFRRFGGERLGAAVRSWHDGARCLAVGLLDEPEVLRVAIAPDAQQDQDLAHGLVADITDPERGVLPAGKVSVEAPAGSLLRELLEARGWTTCEQWSPLRRDLANAVPDSRLRIEVVGLDQVAERVAVQRASFDNSTFSEQRWHDMAAGSLYVDARCLLAYDDDGAAVATATVWSAGVGKPGLLEPLGVHRDHRGHRYGTAISLAAAAALRDMGSSSAVVCTPSSNAAAVATYASAGFERLPEVADLERGDG